MLSEPLQSLEAIIKSKNYLGHMCAVMGIAAWTGQSNAGSVVPGSSCHSITPGQATKMEWREQGLKNKAAQDYWVNCPFERPITKSELIVSIRAVNESSDATGCNATFRKFTEGDRDNRPSLAAPSQRESSRPCSGQLVLDTKIQSLTLRASYLTV